jgi:hypothetical protein
VHADNGSAKIAKSVAQLLIDLDVSKLHSRPQASDDNPYSEVQLKTLKYRPDYLEHFGYLLDARAWTQAFFAGYNQVHHLAKSRVDQQYPDNPYGALSCPEDSEQRKILLILRGFGGPGAKSDEL